MMTNEEAIYLLRNTGWLAPSLEPIDEAIEMACEALRKTEQTDNPCKDCKRTGKDICWDCVIKTEPQIGLAYDDDGTLPHKPKGVNYSDHTDYEGAVNYVTYTDCAWK